VERDLDVILGRTCAVLGQQLGADLANVLERSPDADRFVLRAGWNWPEAWVGTRTVPAGRRWLCTLSTPKTSSSGPIGTVRLLAMPAASISGGGSKRSSARRSSTTIGPPVSTT